MKRGLKSAFLFIFMVLYLAILGMTVTAFAQIPAINGTVSQTNIQPNEVFTLTLSVDSEVDAFYFGVEVLFDPQAFEFVNETGVGLMGGGITIANLLKGNRVGASVTLTNPLVSPGSGDLLELTFRVKQAAQADLSSFTFEATELFNAEGTIIETLDPAEVTIEVDEGVSNLKLAISAANQISEGDELLVSGSVYVNDITVDESTESARVDIWIGINTSDTDPSGWGETAWVAMDFESQLNNYHLYQQNVGFMMEPGTYFIALRAQLDSQNYVYGGQNASGGGIWDGTENSNAQLTISENPAFRYVLAGWDFDEETLLASRSVPTNEDIMFQLVGASSDGYSSGAMGQAANADGWQFLEGDEKYWLAVLSTEGFKKVTISSRQYGTGSSPRDFEIEASLDSLSWEPVSTDTIKIASNWSSGVVENLLLPVAYENKAKIYIRWIRRGDERVDGEGSITTGDNRIDHVYIHGENRNPFEVGVWPGDTDDNGEVDELDVLPLGQYWLSEGPVPIYPGIDWVEQTVEAWIPETATYADANGDGIVTYKDLLPVGFNFGKTSIGGKILSNQVSPIAEISIPPVDLGDIIRVNIKTEEPIPLTGISYRIRVDGINSSAWRLNEVTSGEWAEDWLEHEDMLSFEKHDVKQSRAVVTSVVKGKAKPKLSSQLGVFRIEAIKDWGSSAKIILERVVAAKGRDTYKLESARLETEEGIVAEPGQEIPAELLLRQNYPNPFNPSTVISYSLPNDGPASLVLYDLLGREVVTLFDEAQKAGTYDLSFDASNLSSGIYLYRLKVEGKVLTRKLTLIR